MHFDLTISLGNILMTGAFLFAGIIGWRDLTWRIRNLEVWRKEHMIDSDARDAILKKMEAILAHLRWQTKQLTTIINEWSSHIKGEGQ